MPRTKLSSQPANFWIGAFMVEAAFGSFSGLWVSLIVAVLAGLGCAWLGHRLGLGR